MKTCIRMRYAFIKVIDYCHNAYYDNVPFCDNAECSYCLMGYIIDNQDEPILKRLLATLFFLC
jgi:hypothetical protein